MSSLVAEIRMAIFVISTHRSETTLLGRALAEHPDGAYWDELRHVWSRGTTSDPTMC